VGSASYHDLQLGLVVDVVGGRERKGRKKSLRTWQTPHRSFAAGMGTGKEEKGEGGIRSSLFRDVSLQEGKRRIAHCAPRAGKEGGGGGGRGRAGLALNSAGAKGREEEEKEHSFFILFPPGGRENLFIAGRRKRRAWRAGSA